MGGRSSSSNETTTTNNTDIFEASSAVNDSSVGDGQRLNVSISGEGNDAKITTTDHGAVNKALDTVSEVIEGSERRQSEVLKKVTDLARSTALNGNDLGISAFQKAAIAVAISAGVVGLGRAYLVSKAND